MLSHCCNIGNSHEGSQFTKKSTTGVDACTLRSCQLQGKVSMIIPVKKLKAILILTFDLTIFLGPFYLMSVTQSPNTKRHATDNISKEPAKHVRTSTVIPPNRNQRPERPKMTKPACEHFNLLIFITN